MNVARGLLHPRRRLVWIGAALAILALSIPVGLYVLRGASGSATTGSEPAVVGDRSAASAAPAGSVAGGQAKESGAPLATEADSSVVDATKLVRSAWLEITVADPTIAAGRVRDITTTAGGRIISENVVLTPGPENAGSDVGAPVPAPGGSNEAHLVLGVPNDKLDAVLGQLSQIGEVTHRSTQSDDVTDTYVDTRARVATMQAGVDRLRALIAQATNLGQIVSLESELTRRQADLDGLRARLTELERRTAQSQVTVTLTTTGSTAVDTGGILGALRGAWDALLTSATVILTGLAAILPWLLLLAVVGLVVRWALRRRHGPATAPD